MKKAIVFLLAITVFAGTSVARVDKALIINGPHDLRSSGKGGVDTGVLGPSYALCNYCHITHKLSGNQTPDSTNNFVPGALLWNHKLSQQTTYTVYNSSTLRSKDIATIQPTFTEADLGNPSILCMSCHDGTVALSSTYTGDLGTTGKFAPSAAVIAPADVSRSHPINFTYDSSLAASAQMRVPAGLNGVDADTAQAVFPLYGGKMQCSTCHEPHTNTHYLLRNTGAVYTVTNGSWCLYCHSDDSGSKQ